MIIASSPLGFICSVEHLMHIKCVVGRGLLCTASQLLERRTHSQVRMVRSGTFVEELRDISVEIRSHIIVHQKCECTPQKGRSGVCGAAAAAQLVWNDACGMYLYIRFR
jgi:hypothetical protein